MIIYLHQIIIYTHKKNKEKEQKEKRKEKKGEPMMNFIPFPWRAWSIQLVTHAVKSTWQRFHSLKIMCERERERRSFSFLYNLSFSSSCSSSKFERCSIKTKWIIDVKIHTMNLNCHLKLVKIVLELLWVPNRYMHENLNQTLAYYHVSWTYYFKN